MGKRKKKENINRLKEKYFLLREQTHEGGFKDEESPRFYEIIYRSDEIDSSCLSKLQNAIGEEKSFLRIYEKYRLLDRESTKREKNSNYIGKMRLLRWRLGEWSRTESPEDYTR